jgi:hypothetical protein
MLVVITRPELGLNACEYGCDTLKAKVLAVSSKPEIT